MEGDDFAFFLVDFHSVLCAPLEKRVDVVLECEAVGRSTNAAKDLQVVGEKQFARLNEIT